MTTQKANRRKIGLLAVCLPLLAGCYSRITHIEPRTDITMIDFTEYTNQGFLFTPEGYDGKYETIASIDVVMYAEGNLERLDTGGEDWIWSLIRTDDALRTAFESVKAKGANAIIRMSIDAVTEDYQARVPAHAPGIKVKGLAIRRLGL